MKKINVLLTSFILMFAISVNGVDAQSATSSASSSATISTSSATSTNSTTSSTKGGVSMPEELPATGSTETTIIIVMLGMLAIGVGLYTHYALPLVLEEES